MEYRLLDYSETRNPIDKFMSMDIYWSLRFIDKLHKKSALDSWYRVNKNLPNTSRCRLPAIINIKQNSYHWYKHKKRHNILGPAVMYRSLDITEYYIDGIYFSKNEFSKGRDKWLSSGNHEKF